MIVLAGQRVAQLQKGARARVTVSEKEKMTTVAVREVMEDQISFSVTTEKEAKARAKAS